MSRAYKQLYNSEFLRYYAFVALISLIILNSVFYLFFVNLGVSEIFLKKQVLIELNDLMDENEMLHGKYLEESKKINIDYAVNQGYIDVKSPQFVKRTTAIMAVSPLQLQ